MRKERICDARRGDRAVQNQQKAVWKSTFGAMNAREKYKKSTAKKYSLMSPLEEFGAIQGSVLLFCEGRIQCLLPRSKEDWYQREARQGETEDDLAIANCVQN